MNCLTLDLGTKTGWALNVDGYLQFGTWVLATPKELVAEKKNRMDRRCDLRVIRLFDKVTRALSASGSPFRFVVFEDVQFSSFTKQTQLWSSLRGAVWAAARNDGRTTLECVPVTTLKQFTTGSGAADKDAMAAAMVRHMPDALRICCKKVFKRHDETIVDDNAIDALALWRWAQYHLSKAP